MSFDSLDVLARANPDYVDRLYRQYRQDPNSVDERWALVFAGYEFALSSGAAATPAGPQNPPGVLDLVHSFRAFGHLIADSDPLGQCPTEHPFFEEVESRFAPEDLARTVTSPFHGLETTTLKQLEAALRETYCGGFTVEFMHLFDKERRDWLLERMEPARNRPQLEPNDRRRVLKRLIMAEGFERFLHTKYRGSKRFSLEGGEALIPLLDTLVEETHRRQVEEIVFGMPHRGRLNVLGHILKKPYENILAEFEGLQEQEDVKYHLGYSHDHVTSEGHKIHLTLSANPSHLEAVDPVVLGMVRAKQTARADANRERVIPVLMHGDAAFTGEGIVYETLELSSLDSFTIGGTIHILINNQVGFTTDPEDGRSTPYASDVARVLQAPVFHVNADDPEAAVWAAELAFGFRQRFKTDVFINLVCYRRYGHNELDDPTFTQPRMYAVIKNHPTVDQRYEGRLVDDGAITPEDAQAMRDEVRDRLEEALKTAREHKEIPKVDRPFEGEWAAFGPAGEDWTARTRVEPERLKQIAESITRLPEGFTPHARIPKLFGQMRDLVASGRGLHWAAGETLAYGALLLEGTPVRLCGQDSARGTFSHRHAVLFDAETGEPYVPLNHIEEGQAEIEVVNSPLSEAGVLGFEYGMSSADPYRLFIWEAQYGDFANGAQVVIDQFIASAEAKWKRQSGLVLLLPHGYEGQGPEHSSARLERYLQLCADRNMQVIHPTTPAQIFHALRRQMHRPFRKPLVVMSPKSMLRHKEAVSDLADFTERDFSLVLPDPSAPEPEGVRRVLLCSGKVYYTLSAARAERELGDEVALVRVEQLYPFPADETLAAVGAYPQEAEVLWVQEEPQNQGAWPFVGPRLHHLLEGRGVRYVGRPASASPATGSFKVHQAEEKALVDAAFDLERQGAPVGEPVTAQRSDAAQQDNPSPTADGDESAKAKTGKLWDA